MSCDPLIIELFTGAPGAAGADGAQGPQGPAGPAGTVTDLTGDISVALDNIATVTGLRGIPISTTAPEVNQVLAYNGTQYVPTVASTSIATTSQLGVISVGDNLIIDLAGRLSATGGGALPIATTSQLGGLKASDSILVDPITGVATVAITGASLAITEFTADGTQTTFSPINSYNGTDSNGYLVTVQGIDQPFTVNSSNSGTIVFDAAPPAGSLVRVRALTPATGGGGGGSDVGGTQWSTSTTYKTGDIVVVGTSPIAFVSLQDSNTAHNPLTTIGTWWRIMQANAAYVNGVPVHNQPTTAGQVLSYDGQYWVPGDAGSGNATSIQGVPVDAKADWDNRYTGQAMVWMVGPGGPQGEQAHFYPQVLNLGNATSLNGVGINFQPLTDGQLLQFRQGDGETTFPSWQPIDPPSDATKILGVDLPAKNQQYDQILKFSFISGSYQAFWDTIPQVPWIPQFSTATPNEGDVLRFVDGSGYSPQAFPYLPLFSEATPNEGDVLRYVQGSGYSPQAFPSIPNFTAADGNDGDVYVLSHAPEVGTAQWSPTSLSSQLFKGLLPGYGTQVEFAPVDYTWTEQGRYFACDPYDGWKVKPLPLPDVGNATSLQGNPVSTNGPYNGNLLIWNGINWGPDSTIVNKINEIINWANSNGASISGL